MASPPAGPRVSAATSFAEEAGFRLFLGQSSEFPMMRSRGVSLGPGLSHGVELAASQVARGTSPP